jgi:hypothetical protein
LPGSGCTGAVRYRANQHIVNIKVNNNASAAAIPLPQKIIRSGGPEERKIAPRPKRRWISAREKRYGKSAKILRGAPLPPLIFIGIAKIVAPLAGIRSRDATFKIGIGFAENLMG